MNQAYIDFICHQVHYVMDEQNIFNEILCYISNASSKTTMPEVMSGLAQVNCSMRLLVMKNHLLANLIQKCILGLLTANCNHSSTHLDLSLTKHVCNKMDKSNQNDLGSNLTSFMMKNFGKSGNHEKLTYECHTKEKSEKVTWHSDSLHQPTSQIENQYHGFNSRQESRSSGYQSNNGYALSPMLSPHSNNFETPSFVDSFGPSTSTPRHFNQPPTEKDENQFMPSGGTGNSFSASSSKAAAAANVSMDIPSNSSQSNFQSGTTEKPHCSSTVNNIPVPQACDASHIQSSATKNGSNQTSFNNNSFHSSYVTKSRSCDPGLNTSSNTHHYGLQRSKTDINLCGVADDEHSSNLPNHNQEKMDNPSTNCCTSRAFPELSQETKDVIRGFIYNRMPNDHDWFEFARFGLHLPEQILSGIDTSRQCNNFAKKYYKILAWMHQNGLSDPKDVESGLNRALYDMNKRV